MVQVRFPDWYMLFLALKCQYWGLQVYHTHIPPRWLDPLPIEHACSDDRVGSGRARNGHDCVPYLVHRCRNVRVWLAAFQIRYASITHEEIVTFSVAISLWSAPLP